MVERCYVCRKVEDATYEDRLGYVQYTERLGDACDEDPSGDAKYVVRFEDGKYAERLGDACTQNSFWMLSRVWRCRMQKNFVDA